MPDTIITIIRSVHEHLRRLPESGTCHPESNGDCRCFRNRIRNCLCVDENIKIKNSTDDCKLVYYVLSAGRRSSYKSCFYISELRRLSSCRISGRGRLRSVSITVPILQRLFRGAIQGVDRGQREASLALGMNRSQAMRRIIFPQALRRAIPPLGNQFIITLKDSSLVYVIGVIGVVRPGES